MLFRKEEDGIVAIGQPAHAWVAGQIATAWGNDMFEAPCEEVCLAAQLHDIGFAPWELQPTLNPATGLPHSFLEMPAAIQLPLWTDGIQHLVRFNRYAAMLVSMHFTFLAKRIVQDRPGEDAELAAKFLNTQGELQRTLATSLRNDFYYGSRSTDEEFRRDQEFVSLVDWMSLQILLRFKDPRISREQQARAIADKFELQPLNVQGTEIRLAPWPFKPRTLRLVCDGRRLLTIFTDEPSMREGLRAAAPVTVAVTLRASE